MDDKKALLFIREEIDSIDSELISLLESRLNLSLEIGKIKKRMDKESGKEKEGTRESREISKITSTRIRKEKGRWSQIARIKKQRIGVRIENAKV